VVIKTTHSVIFRRLYKISAIKPKNNAYPVYFLELSCTPQILSETSTTLSTWISYLGYLILGYNYNVVEKKKGGLF
jgi:hypothetical protein